MRKQYVLNNMLPKELWPRMIPLAVIALAEFSLSRLLSGYEETIELIAFGFIFAWSVYLMDWAWAVTGSAVKKVETMSRPYPVDSVTANAGQHG